MQSHHAGHALLFLACSQRKFASEARLPLYELYNGPFWQDLRKYRGGIAWSQVFVLSGKYGFTSSSTLAHAYDARLGPRQAEELVARGVVMPPRNARGEVVGMNVLSQVCSVLPGATTVLIQGGALYRDVFRPLVTQIMGAGRMARDVEILEVKGNAGARAEFRRHLQRINGH